MPRPPPDPIYTLKGDCPVHSLHFWEKARNEKLFAGCQSGQVQLWSLESNRSLEGLQAHSGPCLNVAGYGDSLITQGKGDGHVKVWHSLEGGGWAPSYTIHTRHSIYCRFSILKMEEGEGNSLIACPEDNHSVAVYSLSTGERLAHLNFEDFNKNSKKFGYVMAIKAFCDPHSKQPMLLVGHEGGQLSLRDLVCGGKEICCLNVSEPILCLDFDPTEGAGLYGTADGAYVKKFGVDIKTGVWELGSLTPITNPGISSINIRPDFKIVATGGWDSRLRIFSWHRTNKDLSQSSGVSVADEKKGSNSSQSLSLHQAPSVLASESSLLSVEDNNLNTVLPAHDSNNVSRSLCNVSTTVSSSAHSLVAPAFKRPMKPLAVLNYHTKAIQSVVFSLGPVESWESPCLMAAGSKDGIISLWDIFN